MAIEADIRAGAGSVGMTVLALACFSAASLMLFGHGPREDEPKLPPPGKVADRLAFVEEDVPVRQTRIYDTLAMFALPQAQGSPWGAAEIAIPQGPVRSRVAAAMPRMVEAEAPHARQVLPPVRPTQAEFAKAEPAKAAPTAKAAPVAIATASAPLPGERSVEWMAATASAEPSPIRILGLAVPGSQHLPSGRETMRGVASIGTKAKAIGTGTVATVGGAVSTATDAIVDTFTFR